MTDQTRDERIAEIRQRQQWAAMWSESSRHPYDGDAIVFLLTELAAAEAERDQLQAQIRQLVDRWRGQVLSIKESALADPPDQCILCLGNCATELSALLSPSEARKQDHDAGLLGNTAGCTASGIKRGRAPRRED
jgi:hypothetical protein